VHPLFTEPLTELILGEEHRYAGSLALDVYCQPSQQFSCWLGIIVVQLIWQLLCLVRLPHCQMDAHHAPH